MTLIEGGPPADTSRVRLHPDSPMNALMRGQKDARNRQIEDRVQTKVRKLLRQEPAPEEPDALADANADARLARREAEVARATADAATARRAADDAAARLAEAEARAGS
jgi:hypothetical protein